MLALLQLGSAEESLLTRRHLHRFPSSVSVFERLTLPTSSRKEAAHEAARRLQHVARELCHGRLCPAVSLLCGQDTRLRIPMPSEAGLSFSERTLTQLESRGLIPKPEGKSLRLLLQAASQGNAAAGQALQLDQAVHKCFWRKTFVIAEKVRQILKHIEF